MFASFPILELMCKVHEAIAFIDMMMPEMNGNDVCKFWPIIKSNPPLF